MFIGVLGLALATAQSVPAQAPPSPVPEKCFQSLESIPVPENAEFHSISTDGTRLEFCSKKKIVLFESQTQKKYATDIACDTFTSSGSTDFSRFCAAENFKSVKCFSSGTGKTETITLPSPKPKELITGTSVSKGGLGVRVYYSNGKQEVYSFKTGKSVPVKNHADPFTFTATGIFVTLNNNQLSFQDTATGTQTFQPEADLIKVCGANAEHIRMLTPTPGFVVQTENAVGHCSLPEGTLLQSFPIPAEGSVSFDSSNNVIVRGKTAKESYGLDFNNLKNPLTPFPEDADPSQGAFGFENGNLYNSAVVGAYSKTVWVNGMQFSPPSGELYPRIYRDYFLQKNTYPVGLFKIKSACYSGTLGIADAIALQKPGCANQGGQTGMQTPAPKSESAAFNLLCKYPFSEKDWQLAFPNLREFKNGQISVAQTEALLLKFQKPGAIDLSRDAEVIVSLLKSEIVRKTYATQVAAVLENIATTSAYFYHELLRKIPALFTAAPVPIGPDPNTLCRTAQDEDRLSAALLTKTDKIMGLFDSNAEQMTQAMSPLAGRFGKFPNSLATNWLKQITDTVHKKSEAGTDLLRYGKYPLPFVSDWVQAKLFHTLPSDRSELLFTLDKALVPVVIDTQPIDHDPKLKTPFGFYLKKFSAPSAAIDLDSIGRNSPPINVSWTRGDKTKTITLNGNAEIEERVEEAMLDPVWQAYHGIPFTLNTHDIYMQMGDAGTKLANQYKLTPAEIGTIRGYTGDVFVQVNSALRNGGDELKIAEPYIKVLSRALNKLPKYKTADPSLLPRWVLFWQDGPVQRGASLPKAVLKQHQVGDVVTYDAFTSTSLDHGFYSQHHFIISSHCGRNIEKISAYPNEREVLFLPGAKFKILDRKETMVDKEVNVEFIMTEVGCE